MNFNNKLTKILNETPNDYPIEAAIDEYIDRYNTQIEKAYTHILTDLQNHYGPQIDQQLTQYEQLNYSNALTKALRTIIYTNLTTINPQAYTNPQTCPTQLQNAIKRLTTLATRIDMSKQTSPPQTHNNLTNLATILNELITDLQTTHHHYKQQITHP